MWGNETALGLCNSSDLRHTGHLMRMANSMATHPVQLPTPSSAVFLSLPDRVVRREGSARVSFGFFGVAAAPDDHASSLPSSRPTGGRDRATKPRHGKTPTTSARPATVLSDTSSLPLSTRQTVAHLVYLRSARTETGSMSPNAFVVISPPSRRPPLPCRHCTPIGLLAARPLRWACG
jgi:hypothetical protein